MKSYAMNHCAIVALDGDKIEITGPCCYLKDTTHTVVTTRSQLDLYENTNCKIQDAFPDLDASDREFIKLGYSPDGWDALFGVDEED